MLRDAALRPTPAWGAGATVRGGAWRACVTPCVFPFSPSLPALDWQLPSRSGPYELRIEVQPKPHHRAHYETEGSRGAVKASAGGHPSVQVLGCVPLGHAPMPRGGSWGLFGHRGNSRLCFSRFLLKNCPLRALELCSVCTHSPCFSRCARWLQ